MTAKESRSDLEDATKKLEQLNRIEEQLARIERETMSRSNSSSEQVNHNGNQEIQEPAMEEIQDPDYQLILDAEPSPNTTLDENEQQVLAIASESHDEIRGEQSELEPAIQEPEIEPEQEVEPESECESEPEELPILSPPEELPTEDIEDNEPENIVYSKIDLEQDQNENIPVKNAETEETEELEELELPEVPADVQDDIDKFEELANLVDKSAAELTSNAGSISGER